MSGAGSDRRRPPIEEGLDHAFALVSPRFDRAGSVLRALFEHPWVASYQIGFGPPLVRANPRVTEAARSARSAIDKLEAYLRCCLLDRREQARLAYLHRQLLVRRHGPIEAEEAALRSSEALDLSLRLFAPAEAPVAAREGMLSRGVELAFALGAAPEVLSGRLLVRLDDPRSERLLEVPLVAAAVPPIAPESGEPMALELRVRPEAVPLWRSWLEAMRGAEGLVPVELGDPAALTRVLRDGLAR